MGEARAECLKDRFRLGAGLAHGAVGGGEVVFASGARRACLHNAGHLGGIAHDLEHLQHGGVSIAAEQKTQAAGTGTDDGDAGVFIPQGQQTFIFGQRKGLPCGGTLGFACVCEGNGIFLPFGERIVE